MLSAILRITYGYFEVYGTSLDKGYGEISYSEVVVPKIGSAGKLEWTDQISDV